MQWQHTGNVTCYSTMETRLLLKTCTSQKMQLSEDTDKSFEDKLQKERLGMLLKTIWQTQSTDQKHESDRLMHVHNEENVTTVKKLVVPLRQEGQKQTHRSTSQISKGTDLTQCSIVQIIHCVFVWSVSRLPARMLPNIHLYFTR